MGLSALPSLTAVKVAREGTWEFRIEISSRTGLWNWNFYLLENGPDKEERESFVIYHLLCLSSGGMHAGVSFSVSHLTRSITIRIVIHWRRQVQVGFATTAEDPLHVDCGMKLNRTDWLVLRLKRDGF